MRKITASEGMYFTQRNIENEGARTFAISLYLADNDSENNWREATQEEYYDWQRRQDERMMNEDSSQEMREREEVV